MDAGAQEEARLGLRRPATEHHQHNRPAPEGGRSRTPGDKNWRAACTVLQTGLDGGVAARARWPACRCGNIGFPDVTSQRFFMRRNNLARTALNITPWNRLLSPLENRFATRC